MDIHQGEVVGGRLYPVREFAEILGLAADEVAALVIEGVIEPAGVAPAEWIFAETALLRVQRALRLRQELSIQLPALALVLDLLDEIERLRRRAHVEAQVVWRDVDC